MGNFGGFAAPYVTGLVKDATGSYQAPMFVVGGLLLLSAALVMSIAAARPDPADPDRHFALEPTPHAK